jgi:hypothetical protein
MFLLNGSIAGGALMKHLFLALALFSFSINPLFSQCGGTERWQVKVATDPRHNDVDTTNVIVKTIAELNALPEPTRPTDNLTRLDDEVHVYEVRARLVKFKFEGGNADQDYHLVVSDDTLLFTDSSGNNIGHSVVAEIPHPDCITGMHGDPNIESRFINNIRATRQKLEQRFPVIASSGFTDAGGIPVRIIGVGFFDRPHRQIGRAQNNLELHPILEIDFDALPPPVTPGANALSNPGFEQGNIGWTASLDVITSSASRQGSWGAWLGGYGSPHTDKLYQQVTIPATVTASTLSFFLRIETEETANQAFDTLKVQIRNPNGQLLSTALTLSNRDASSQYLAHTVDLVSFRGQTIRIYFEGKEDNGKATSFFLDDLALIYQ